MPDTTSQPATPAVPLTDAQRRRVIAQGRVAHGGILTLDTRIVILAAIAAVVVLVLVLFFRNAAIGRSMMHEQAMAKRTAQVWAKLLKASLPVASATPPTVPHGASVAPPMLTTAQLKLRPSLRILFAQLQSSSSPLPSGARIAGMVFDTAGWVYVDTDHKSRAWSPAQQASPHTNLQDIPVLSASADKASLGAVMQDAHSHAGIVNYQRHTLGRASTSTVVESWFVQPIATTNFVVAVQVGPVTTPLDQEK